MKLQYLMRVLFVSAIVSAVLAGQADTAVAATIYNNGTPLLVPVPAQGALFADPGNPGFSEAADDFGERP